MPHEDSAGCIYHPDQTDKNLTDLEKIYQVCLYNLITQG